MIVRDWLAAAATSRPQGTALTWEDGDTLKALTFAQLNAAVARWAAALARLGVRAGDHLGLLMPNRADTVSIILAAARLGAILVPLNIRLTQAELAYQIAKARCRVVLHEPEFADLLPATGQHGQQWISVTPDLITEEPPDSEFLDGRCDLNAVQAIVFTSGTSGRPKGAQITFGNHYFSAMGSAARIGLLPEDNWLLCLPLYHVGGLAIIFRSVLYNTTISLFDMHAGFDAHRLMNRISVEAVTLISLVPTMLWRMIDKGFADPSQLRLILLGGAATSPELIRRCAALRLPIVTTYGMTETTSQIATMLPEDVYSKPGSVGKPLMFTQVAVVNSDGEPEAPGAIGEIVVSGRSVMKGYFDADADTRKRGDRLFTGDLGYLDNDGDLWIVQRRSDLIVTGGENVYPSEVEQILRQHPAVADAAVVGIADSEWGQRVAAAVVARPDHAVTPDQLSDFCRQYLAGYKVPRAFRIVDALPQTGSGKVQRTAVVALFSPSSAD